MTKLQHGGKEDRKKNMFRPTCTKIIYISVTTNVILFRNRFYSISVGELIIDL